MDFINEENYLPFALGHFIDYRLKALLKLALILGSSHQRTHIKRIYLLAAQILRNVTTHNTLCKALGYSGLTGTRLTDQHRIVLGTAAQNLKHPSDLLVTSYYRVKLP